jgi:4-carboxymuconolactone decarboxylase
MSTPHSKAALTFEEVRAVSPTLEKYTLDVIVGDLWKRPGLSPRDRSIATLSALIARNQTIGMLYYFNLALDNGVTPAEISEIITHMAFYAGWPNAFSAVAIVKDIFAERGVDSSVLPVLQPELLSLDKVVPEEAFRVEFIKGNVEPVSDIFAKYTGDLLYHEVWLRPGLTPRDRSLVTVAALIALGSTQFLGLYLNRALGHGLTKEQVAELLAHLSFYSGWPNLISASLAVKEIFGTNAS